MVGAWWVDQDRLSQVQWNWERQLASCTLDPCSFTQVDEGNDTGAALLGNGLFQAFSVHKPSFGREAVNPAWNAWPKGRGGTCCPG